MSEFVAITNLPDVHNISLDDMVAHKLPPLLWDLHVPPAVDAERLEVNMTMLKRYQRVGAISSSAVLEYQGETTQFTPGIAGINADGSAIATKSGVLNRAERSKGELFDDLNIPPRFSGEYGRPLMLHKINKAELASKISDEVREHGKTREQAWARQLDLGMRESFRKGGKEHLVLRGGEVAVYRLCNFFCLGRCHCE